MVGVQTMVPSTLWIEDNGALSDHVEAADVLYFCWSKFDLQIDSRSSVQGFNFRIHSGRRLRYATTSRELDSISALSGQ